MSEGVGGGVGGRRRWRIVHGGRAIFAGLWCIFMVRQVCAKIKLDPKKCVSGWTGLLLGSPSLYRVYTGRYTTTFF
jgi:hypothetical protein